jgi:hypothetical protein
MFNLTDRDLSDILHYGQLDNHDLSARHPFQSGVYRGRSLEGSIVGVVKHRPAAKLALCFT